LQVMPAVCPQVTVDPGLQRPEPRRRAAGLGRHQGRRRGRRLAARGRVDHQRAPPALLPRPSTRRSRCRRAAGSWSWAAWGSGAGPPRTAAPGPLSRSWPRSWGQPALGGPARPERSSTDRRSPTVTNGLEEPQVAGLKLSSLAGATGDAGRVPEDSTPHSATPAQLC